MTSPAVFPRLLSLLLLSCCCLVVTTAQTETLFPTGPIPELSCNVEDLETANDSQLYSILQELVETNFFRNFVVDLEEPCPLKKKKQQQKQPSNTNTNSKKPSAEVETKSTSQTTAAIDEEAEDDDFQCASEGLPDLDPDAEPACHVEESDPSDLFGSTSSGSSSSFDTSSTKEKVKDEDSSTTDAAKPGSSSIDADDGDQNGAPEEDDDFECTGGDEFDMDDDAEPLCSLDTSSEYTRPLQSLLAMALESIRALGGVWESESQRQTYQWTTKTDPINYNGQEEAACNDDVLPDTFWQDMCSSISTSQDSSKVINLVLNPERNTGYNGTHIWNAIYEENCLADQEMCYEERVMYRLLSGLHTSTTISIAHSYYPPSKRKNRTTWEPNPTYFYERFGNGQEYIRNLHFSYVVLLRALQKAAPMLYKFEISTANYPLEDQKATHLLKRLLDSSILKSCQPVFTAFDERLMFKGENGGEDAAVVALQKNFKGVFHNISSILDCVQCQQCKLHGKMSMLGYGAALKILFTKAEVSLERNELVAFINTVAKFSSSLKEVRELTDLYWEEQKRKEDGGIGGTASSHAASSASSSTVGSSSLLGDGASSSVDLMDTAVGLISSLARNGHLNDAQESHLIQLAMKQDPGLLVLAKHYGRDADKFLSLVKISTIDGAGNNEPDAIIVGSGLAGMAAALNILDRGGRITMIEKEHLLGGNSNKASSGINGCCPNGDDYGDYLEAFRNDTIKSAGESVQPELIDVLVSKSSEAVMWLKERVGVDLSLLAQLGGHSFKRTHRPNNGMAGAEIIFGMQKAVKAYQKEGKAKILVDTKVTSLLTDDNGRVIGVRTTNTKRGTEELYHATNTILATGGFASDRRSGSYLDQYRPELMNLPATAGPFSTGDGVALATELNAGTVDMDKIQIHPTGWVDPSDPSSKSKTLAAELMRGVGGLLFNAEGKRFCNELGTRAYVTNKMLSHDEHFRVNQKWDKAKPVPTFSLVLSSAAALDGQKHVDLYSHKGLMTRIEGLAGLAEWMGVDIATLRLSYNSYLQAATSSKDEFGKVSFRGLPSDDLEKEVFYAGRVVPVLHYCMGGITIDPQGNVLTADGSVIPGLHAAGEVTGGVHGGNRLGGNSLLECTVFGSLIGRKLPVKDWLDSSHSAATDSTTMADADVPKKKVDRQIPLAEVEEHNNDGDCWAVIHGVVYDLTEFADEHPGGAESVHVLAGKDGSEAFAAVHNEDLLEDFETERMGVLV